MTDGFVDGVSGAVVPVGGALGNVAQAPGDPWAMLANGTGMLIRWRALAPADAGPAWGPVLKQGSAFAQQLLNVADQAGARTAVTTGATLFRLELPTGQTLQQLVPAVGGGFRGMTRASDSTKIAGQARLIPVSGAATGAGLALGPLVGLMALSVGAEMLARHEQEKKIQAILDAVQGIQRHLQQQIVAELKTAEQALEAATAAIVDQVAVPQGIGLSSAVTGLRNVRNQALNWLEQWEERVSALPSDGTGVSLSRLHKALDVGLGGSDSFPAHVMVLYRALVLESRAQVVTAAEAALANPGQTLRNLEASVQQRLEENTAAQERLRELLLTLNEHPLTVGLPARPATSRKVAQMDRTLARLTHAIVKAPDAPPVLSAENRQVLEAVRHEDGTVSLLQPRLTQPA
jgi:hypothetical protein